MRRITRMSKAWRYIPTLVMVVCVGSSVRAQDKDLKPVEIVVQTSFKPAVTEAVRLMDEPQIPDTTLPTPKLEYEVLPRQVATDYAPEPITAAKFKGEKLPRLYRGYFQGGVGNYTTPYAELYLNSIRNKKYSQGLHLKHMSSAGNLLDYGYSGFSDNLATVYGKQFLSTFTLNESLNWNRQVVHYYGFNDLDTLIPYYHIPVEKNDIKQRFVGLDGNIGFLSQQVDTGKMHLHGDLGFRRFEDLYGTGESHLRIQGGMEQAFHTEFLQIDLRTDYYRQALVQDTASAIILNLNPRISTRREKWYFTLGLNLFLESDSLREITFFPDVQLGFHLIPKVLTAYVQGIGDVERNDLGRLAEANPFISTDSRDFLMKNRRELKVRGGLRGALSQHTAFHVNYSLSNIENELFFIQDPDLVLYNKFLPVYDGLMAHTFRGEVSFDDQRKIRVTASAQYATYETDSIRSAWYRPQMKGGLSARYNMQNKILLQLDAFYVGKRPFLDPENPVVKTDPYLKGYLDLNLRVEYRYSKILSAFVRLQNLTGKRYMVWNNYPSQRIQLLAGFSYSFWGQ
ncbi:MAG: TonB-dependent receptor [Flavobacteriales bacterium]|nr:TonB-dependent receptor [Flavobacteriales bacterium]MCB9447431.1 TonB-dependent receptor [Flavobacteriales bacterium]